MISNITTAQISVTLRGYNVDHSR